MSTILEKLQPFLPVSVFEKGSEFDEDVIDLIDVNLNEEIGSYSVNKQGELDSFSLLEEAESGQLTKDEIRAIAEKFRSTFYPDQTEVELSAIIHLDNLYMVSYEERDEKYGLFLHSTGFTISVSNDGQITHFYKATQEYEVHYSDVMISEEQALEQYAKGLDFELNIQRFDQDVYKNGDNQYHLAYSIIEQVMDIPIDGSETSSIREEHDLLPAIDEREAPKKDIYELVGFNSEYKLLDSKVEDGKRIEVWSKLEDVDQFSFDMEETNNHVGKICFDEKTGMILQMVSGEEHGNDEEEIGIQRAKEKALDLMFTLFPDTHERFRLEILDDGEFVEEEFEDDECEGDLEEEMEELESLEEELEELEEWDEELVEQECTYTFYFHLFHKGIRVDQHVSVIEVGRYSGKINQINLDLPPHHPYSELPTTPMISETEAKEIYLNLLQIELMFIQELTEDEKSVYSLTYVPAFPETVGHVRAIDAMTGKAMYVDVGDALFFS